MLTSQEGIILDYAPEIRENYWKTLQLPDIIAKTWHLGEGFG